jgi:hypothetical protein
MGMAIFGATVREFATLQAAMETLFALMNGDSVLQLLQVRNPNPKRTHWIDTYRPMLGVCPNPTHPTRLNHTPPHRRLTS